MPIEGSRAFLPSLYQRQLYLVVVMQAPSFITARVIGAARMPARLLAIGQQFNTAHTLAGTAESAS